MRYIIVVLSMVALMFSCTEQDNVNVSDIEINTKLVRFDSLFYNSDEVKLQQLKEKYPLMLSTGVDDTVWINKIKNEQEIYQKSVKVFGDFKEQYSEIIDLFKHIKFYYPEFESPEVFTILSDFDYQYPVLYTPKRLFVSLDMYLGKDEEEYEMFPHYMVKNMVKERIKVDVANAISKNYIAQDRFDRSLLSQMIYHGKILYLAQRLIPTASKELLIGYTKEELSWCENNEKEIWAYMVKNKLFYDSDDKLIKRFISMAPFTKFYLNIDRESPGRAGVWLGWQIVNSYMEENPGVSLQQLMSDSDARKIFKKSRYKPSK